MICSGVWRRLLLVMVTPVFQPRGSGASATLITRGPKSGGSCHEAQLRTAIEERRLKEDSDALARERQPELVIA